MISAIAPSDESSEKLAAYAIGERTDDQGHRRALVDDGDQAAHAVGALLPFRGAVDEGVESLLAPGARPRRSGRLASVVASSVTPVAMIRPRVGGAAGATAGRDAQRTHEEPDQQRGDAGDHRGGDVDEERGDEQRREGERGRRRR